jgi:hypothetical protein
MTKAPRTLRVTLPDADWRPTRLQAEVLAAARTPGIRGARTWDGRAWRIGGRAVSRSVNILLGYGLLVEVETGAGKRAILTEAGRAVLRREQRR